MNHIESFETESDSFLNNYQKEINNNSSVLSLSYISNENINRCWFFLTDIITLGKLSKIDLINHKLDKGNNIFKIGNEFSCYAVGISKLHYKCIESENKYFIKKISWIISLDIGPSFKKTYILYPITSNNKTLIKIKFEIIQPDNKNELIEFNETRDYYNNLQYSIINTINETMNKSNEFLFIYESFISNLNFENCWNIMTDFNILSSITSDIGENFICNGDKEKIGAFWKCNLYNYKKTIYFRIKNIEKNKKRNKWLYCLETIGTELEVVKKQIEISITKINENSSQVSINVIFKDNINKIVYEYKKKKINEVMKKIKAFMNKKGIYLGL